MSIESVQFTEMVRIEFIQLEIDRKHREIILNNIALALLNGEITEAQAEEARKGLIP